MNRMGKRIETASTTACIDTCAATTFMRGLPTAGFWEVQGKWSINEEET